MENSPKNKVLSNKTAWNQRFLFATYFVIVFLITFSVLYLFNLIPGEFQTVIGRYPDTNTTLELPGELPLSITIPEVNIDAQVYNPATTSVAVLDSFLLKGAVRYPGSGLLGRKGNILIFGHSTSFKIVHNQAYKTFVGLKDLKAGDLISIFSDTYEYTYKVNTVDMKEADQVLIEFNTDKSLLTLATCNTSIGDKSARYVVVAEFVRKI